MKSTTSAVPPIVMAYPHFPHYDNQYICCCGIHVLTGAKLVAIYEIIRIVLLAILSEYLEALLLIIPLFLLVGINSRKSGYLLASVVFYIFYSVLYTVLFFCYVAVAVGMEEAAWLVAAGIVAVLGACFNVWLLFIIFGCCKYLSDLEEHIGANSPPAYYV